MVVGCLTQTLYQAALRALRQELNKGQVVMRIHRAPQVRSRDKPTLSHALHFRRETLHQIKSGQVFEDRVGIDDIEGFVCEGQGASIENDCLHAGKTVAVILHVGERKAASGDLGAVFIEGFQLLRQSNLCPGCSHIQDAHLGSRVQRLQEEPMLLLARFAMQIEEQAVHLWIDSIASPVSAHFRMGVENRSHCGVQSGYLEYKVMRTARSRFVIFALLVIPVLLAVNASAQASTVKVVVIKDDSGKPVRNAAVVLHPVKQNGKQAKGGIELKTDAEGKTESDGMPYGTLRVQVIAPGFQTFGEDYTINQPEQTVTVRLKRPQGQYTIYGEPGSGPAKDKQ